MRQAEGTTLGEQAQSRILDEMFLPTSESQKRARMWERSARYKTPVGKKRPLKTVVLAVKLCRKILAKEKQPKVARVELRAGGGLHGPEKPG